MSELDGLAPSTLAVVAGRPARVAGGPVNPGIELSSTFHAGGTASYGRDGNATWDALEAAVGTLEGGQALVFGSGMGAVNAVLDLVAVGGVVVAPTQLYSGTSARLAEWEAAGRVRVRRVAPPDTAGWQRAVAGADLVWLESPTNPLLQIVDLPAVSAAARAAGAITVCDSTFATPIAQRPLTLGVDVVLHSVTKFLSGHSDVLLGAVVTADGTLADRLRQRRSLLGAVAGPVEAWLALRGLRTLALRMERAQQTAGLLARRLLEHPAVGQVRYPGLPTDPGHAVAARQMTGFGAMVAFDVLGDAVAAQAVCSRTRIWSDATSLGGVESTLERRARWATESSDVPPSLIRLSVGCEDPEDLWRDLTEALAVVPAPHSSST
ncbi:MAG: aminotransferase class I/II-fold pyridoxal phosphate-dependent enzyme [Actinomycetota bacterium]|nr:MAG: aminotransferase class I/II-fold pyridoxal phosphate-dependent enzyme [Actinomycetota bacterium]